MLSVQGICSYCFAHLPQLPPCCPRCGLPSAFSAVECGRCQQQPPAWQALVAVSDYIPPLSRLLHRFKFGRHSELGRSLARLMLLRWLTARREGRILLPQRIFAVPLTRRKQWQRGFNQSNQLAFWLAHWINCPFDRRSLRRVRHTLAQTHLSARQRQTNVRGAFTCSADLSGLNVMLVDDVVTTGSTLSEITRLLHKKGAATVQVCCLCRTL